MREEIARFKKNESQDVVVQVVEFKGEPRLDVRAYFMTTAGESVPTKAGVSLRPAEARALLGVLERVNLLTPAEERVGFLERSPTHRVMVDVREFRGHRVVDMRNFFLSKGGWTPTLRGLAVNFVLLDDLRRALAEGLKRFET